ncbi:thioesterase family protein [Actinoplanes sp. NPDC051851]|uniref:thioesterase family protein n=1 Tax=Actinoplanes sp. NPDC051851 TaxID=3154753 RepID=UPI003446F280
MTDEPEAFYLPVGDGEFESTPATASPWDEEMQHGGPPTGLLARAVELTRPDPGMPIARLTADFHGAIPQGRVRTEARIVRPGRRIEMVEAALSVNGKVAVTATAWRIKSDREATAGQASTATPPPLPDAQPPVVIPGVSPSWGYGRALEWRFVEGSYAEPGPVSLWARVRLPLVAGEKTVGEGPSTVQHLAVLADSTNGVSAELPFTEWFFIPPTVTLTIARPPEGEWLHLAGRTTITPHGTGVAQGEISDERGLVALVGQPLLVAPRG